MDTRKWYRMGAGAMVLVLILALAASVAAGCGDSANAAGGPLKLGEQDNGKSFTVMAGDTIQVVLPGNPTTGYSWTAALSDGDAALLEQVGEPAYQQDPAEGEIVGAGGTFTFTFKAANAGEATIKLVYERGWEDVDPLQTFEARIAVE